MFNSFSALLCYFMVNVFLVFLPQWFSPMYRSVWWFFLAVAFFLPFRIYFCIILYFFCIFRSHEETNKNHLFLASSAHAKLIPTADGRTKSSRQNGSGTVPETSAKSSQVYNCRVSSDKHMPTWHSAFFAHSCPVALRNSVLRSTVIYCLAKDSRIQGFVDSLWCMMGNGNFSRAVWTFKEEKACNLWIWYKIFRYLNC